MIKKIYLSFLLILFANLHIHATKVNIGQEKIFSCPITVINKSNTKIFVATYYKKTFNQFKCNKHSKIKEINPSNKAKIDKPAGKLPYGRKLIFTKNKDLLKENLSEIDYRLITKRGIEDIDGLKFYIKTKDNVLKGYTHLEWKITKPFWEFFSSIKNSIFDKIIKKLTHHKHRNKKTQVEKLETLSLEEKTFLSKRKIHVHESIEKLFNTKIKKNKIPNIAFCCSGGGYRAMIGTLGAMLGLEKIGVLNCANYVSCLSGSTWLMAPWTMLGIPLKEYKKKLRPRVEDAINIKSLSMQKAIKLLAKKVLFDQKVTLVDLYGALLANRLLNEFKSKKQKVYLSDSATNLESGQFPLPIYTAVETTANYNWFEFTPYKIGSIPLNYYVKTWAFGRKFANGKSKDYPPEQNLGFLMGIFGSAFAANYEEIIDAMQDKPKTKDFYDLVYFLTSQPNWKKIRISAAKVRNFMYGIDESPLKNKKNLTLVDAGVAINLPFPPLLKPERKIDIIIACDFSTSAQYGKELKKASKYAKENGLKFPPINLSKLKSNIITVFKDKKDPTVPVVIYCPLIKNKKFSKKFDPYTADYCNTFNFSYSNNEFDELTALMKFNITQNKTKIINEIFEVIKNK